MNTTYEIEIWHAGTFAKTTFEVFRSWSGRRKINGVLYSGPVYEYMSDKIHSWESGKVK